MHLSSPGTLWVHLQMLVCAILVSTSFTVGAGIAHGLDPAVLTLIRFILASLFFAPLIIGRHSLRVSLFDLLRYSCISGCLVIFFWCMFVSLRYTTALNTSAIFTLVPAISGIYAIILIREQLGRKRLIALCLAIPGALLIIFQGDLQAIMSMSLNKGDAIFFLGCLAMGLYTPLVRLLHRGEPMLVMVFWVMITGIGWLMIPAGPKLGSINWPAVPWNIWAGIVYLALFTTNITFFITQLSILSLGPTRVMAYSYLYPGLVLLIDIILGHPIPQLAVLPGIAIVLLAMVVIQT